MTASLVAIRLPEGGRAALSFPFDTNWAKTQRNAMLGATRAKIHQHWKDFPQFVRQDQGFQSLMDHYCPVIDAEEYARQEKEHLDKVIAHVRNLFGTRFNPDTPISDDEIIRAIKAIPKHRACVDIGITFGGGTAISTNSTTRTVVGLQNPAQQAVRHWGFDIGFDGTTSTNGPAIVELDTNTWATNAPGTNSTSVTPNKLDSGRPETVQSTCAKAWTTEPTVLSPVELCFVPSYMGSALVFSPLTKPFVSKGGGGFSLRLTQQTGVTANVTGTLKSEE